MHDLSECEVYFKTFCRIHPREQLLTVNEFIEGCHSLNLVPEICMDNHLSSFFGEMDTAKTGKVTLDQVRSYVMKISGK